MEPDGACGPGVIAQVGFGPLDSNPATEHGWIWTNSLCNELCAPESCGFNDEYMTTLTFDAVGEWAMAYRFSHDDGITYRYCDTSGTDPADSYDSSSQSTIAVTP